MFSYRVKGRRKFAVNLEVDLTGSKLNLNLSFPDNPDENQTYISDSLTFYHPLQRGLNIRHGARNTFRDVYKRVHKNLFHDVWEEHPTVDPATELRSFLDFLEEVQDIFLETLDPDLVKLCRRFSTSRWQHYQFFKTHDHPYVRQLITTCPGLLSALVVAHEKSLLSEGDISKLVKRVKRGEKIKSILEAFFKTLLMNPLNETHHFDLWKVAFHWSKYRWPQMKEDWIWLVQNATTLSSGYVLLMPPPAYLCKSDLPELSRKRANWYKRIHSLSILMMPETDFEVSPTQLKGLSQMVSKADEKFYQYASRRKSGLVEFLKHTNRCPSGKTSYKSFLKEAAQFRKSRASLDEGDLKKREALEIVKTSNRVQECVWSYEDSEVKIIPIVTWDDFQKESKQMSNCIRKLWYDAYEKRFAYFHVVYKDAHYTMDIELPYVTLSSIKGFKNSEASEDLLTIVEKIVCEERSRIISPVIPAPCPLGSNLS